MLLLIIKENYGGGTEFEVGESVYPDMFYILLDTQNGELRGCRRDLKV